MIADLQNSRRTSSSSLVLIGLACAGLWLGFLLLQPFWKPLMCAAVLAILFSPIHARLGLRIRNRTVAAFMCTVLVITVAVIPAIVLGLFVAGELQEIYAGLRASAKPSGAAVSVTQLLDGVVAWIARLTGTPAASIREIVNSKVQSEASNLIRIAAGFATGIVTAAVGAVVTFLTLFFLFREKDAVLNGIALLLPLSAAEIHALYSRIGETLAANVYGVFAAGTAQGLACGLAFWFVGLPSPAIWGIVTGLFSVVPVIGSSAVWIPASLILLISGAWGKAAFMVLWGVCVVGLVDNVVRPLVIGTRTKLHPLVMFFALLGGVRVFGVIGLFIGPVILAVTLALLSTLRPEFERWKRERACGRSFRD